MFRFCMTTVLTAWVMVWISSPLVAQDDFLTLLQEQLLEIPVADLISNDTNLQITEDFEPFITIFPEASHGDVWISDGHLRYQPNDEFFGVDTFSYRWIGPSGPIEAHVEVFVTPWITPLVGPMGLLNAGPDTPGVGYYNSYSGTFYFCAAEQELSSDGILSCTSYRYPGVEPGWLPLMGTWLTAEGHELHNRPGLYDPVTRRVLLLDKGPACVSRSCTEITGPLPLTVVEHFELDNSDLSAVIPIAADLHGNGFDSILSYRLSTNRFDGEPLLATYTPYSEEPTVWPMAVANVNGFDDVGVFGQESGQLMFLSKPEEVSLWGSAASIATARWVDSSIKYEVYNAQEHRLQVVETVGGMCLDEVWVPDGTQIVRFPSDPDPPPSSGGGGEPEPPCP